MIPLFKVFMSDEAVSRASEVLKSGYIGQGAVVEEFEGSLRRLLNNDYIASTNSATSAEHLAYHLLRKPAELFFNFPGEQSPTRLKWQGLCDGDEVLATPLTCTATNWPILANRLSIKWVDIDPETLSLDLDDLRRKITPRTKIISIVHWGGYPAPLDEIRKIQLEAKERFDFFPIVIEDCAHGLGSRYESLPLGSHGNICTFSFQAIKHITSVDGGALALSDQNLYSRAKLLRWYGIDRDSNRKDFRCEADISEWGYKFHMNDVSAAIGSENLKYLDYVSDGFKRCRDFYRERLAGFSGLSLIQNNGDNKRDWNPWLFSLLVQEKAGFYGNMHSKCISVSQVHERNDKHTCTADYRVSLPSLDKICEELICLPCGWWVSDDQLDYICNTIQAGWM